MSKYKIKNNGTIGSVGDNNTVYNSSSNFELINQIDKILINIDEVSNNNVEKKLLEAKSDLENNNTSSAIERIKKVGPLIYDVAKDVGANLISDIITNS